MSQNIKFVNPLYMNQASPLIHKALITKVGISEVNKQTYRWVQLNETIFHPKGGGQLPDEGTINGMSVVFVHKEVYDTNRLDQFEILHCFDQNQELSFKEGDEVELIVDPIKRKLHTRLHTAGHLIAEAVEKNYPELKAYQGNHYPDSSYVRFRLSEPNMNFDKEEIRQKAEVEFHSWIEADLPVFVQILPTGLRSIKITKDWTPCGGTHLETLKDIGSIEIPDVSLNKKEGTVTVKYKLF